MRLLPWDYAVRNLLRRPLRTWLTAFGLTLVVFLILVVLSFLQGLEAGLQQSGDEQIVMVHSLIAADNLENSSISDQVPVLVRNELSALLSQQGGVPGVSPELVVATTLGETTPTGPAPLALLRGVLIDVFRVRRKAFIVDGAFPKAGQLLVGRFAAVKMGMKPEELATGRTLTMEGKTWSVSGHFAAPGTLLEAELWCPLDDLKLHLKRPNDLSIVALRMNPLGDHQEQENELVYFCRNRHRDLEITTSAEVVYYGSLQKHFQPLRVLAWLMVALIGSAGACGAINTMYAAVSGRVREFGALQAIGFRRRAIAVSLVQESVLLAALATLTATGLALALLHGMAVRFTMGVVPLQLDRQTLLVACGVGLGLGILGAVPPSVRAFRLGIAEALKAA